MNEKELSDNIIIKTIEILNNTETWPKEYSALFGSLLDGDKLSNSTEIYKMVVEEIKIND